MMWAGDRKQGINKCWPKRSEDYTRTYTFARLQIAALNGHI